MGENSNPLAHEMSLGELFQKSFGLLRQNYLKVLPIFVLLGIISAILSSAISYITPTASVPANVSSLSNGQLSSLFNSVSQYLGYTLANYLVSWCILYFAAALGVWRMNQILTHAGDQRGPNYTSLVVTVGLSAVIIEAGAFLFIIGALILGTMLYLVPVAATLEGKSTFDAMRRSRQLASGKWFKTFCLLAGIQIIIAIFSNLVGGFAGLPFTGETSTMAAIVASNFITALSFPLVSASMLVLYYSNIGRKPKESIPRPPSLYDNMRSQPIPGFPVVHNDFCPKCNEVVTQEERYCHNCGSPLQN
ncbi:MAG: zinc ribbon domain-containing protein [Nitrososphaerales archaeon]